MTLPSGPQVPVTVLCGFLGAGKTTVLHHLLRQTEGQRWALIVNDVGAINIDAKLVQGQAAGSLGGSFTGAEVVELENGCVCCSQKDELAAALFRLALTGREGGPAGLPYDHLVVETTGVAEPRGIATLFNPRRGFGPCLSDVARIQNLVTVVDGPFFFQLWQRHVRDASGAVSDRAAESGVPDSTPERVFDLMLEQVEVADVLLINKTDLLTPEAIRQLEEILAGLNLRAERQVIEHGQVARETIIDRARFEPRETLGSARWIGELNRLHRRREIPAGTLLRRPATRTVTETNESIRDIERRYGLTAVAFQSRAPFVRDRLRAWLDRGFPGLVRAKGFFWTQEQPDEMQFLSIAGTVARTEVLNYWWAAMIENGRARPQDRPPTVVDLWEEPHGDRRQELVFIGVDLDRTALLSSLTACLFPVASSGS